MHARIGFRHVLAVCATLLSCSGWAQEPPDPASQAFTAGTAAFQDDDYRRALTHYRDARDAGIQGPAVHYNIAVCHYRLGQYDDAQSEFSLIAERYPAMRALAQYNLGLVAQRQRDDRAAQRHFRAALQNSADEKLRRLAAAQLTQDRDEERPRWFSQVNTRLGHDDNVRLVSDDLPVPSGQSQDSLSTELWASISGPLAPAPGFRLDASLYSVRYQDASFYDQNYLRLGPVYRWQWGNWLAEAGPQLSYSTLDGDGYEERAGIAIGLRRSINARLTFGANLTHDDVDAGGSRFAFVEGSGSSLELSLNRREGRSRMTLSYLVESNDRGVNIASTRQKLRLRYRYIFSERWEGDVQGSVRRSNYDELAQPRHEDLSELALGLTRNLAGNWDVSGTLAVSDNSAIDPYAYDRTRFSVAVSKSFF